MDLDDLIIPANRHGYVYHFVFTRPTDQHEFHYVGQHLGTKADPGYFGSGLRLKRMLEKYGKKGNLRRYGLMFCYSQEELNFSEILMISFAKHLYREDCINLDYGGANGRMHQSTKAKLREARVGKPISAETRAKMSVARLGWKPSAESKAKMREARLGKPSAMAGKKHSEESKVKMSKALRGRKLSEEHKAKMREVNLGKKLSEEHKAKISAAHIGKKHSEESKAKISRSKRGYTTS